MYNVLTELTKNSELCRRQSRSIYIGGGALVHPTVTRFVRTLDNDSINFDLDVSGHRVERLTVLVPRVSGQGNAHCHTSHDDFTSSVRM